ncbi:4-oxalocrotonate tautomerase DmpI [Kribbella sp. NPDC051586]
MSPYCWTPAGRRPISSSDGSASVLRLVRGGRDGWNGLTTQRRKEDPMPIVTVLQGPRTPELKRELVQKVTDAFVDSLGVPAESVQVWIQETPPDSWAIGGTLTADK